MNDMVMRLDDIGKPAWIALMVAGFIVFWPIGLLVLAFLLWSGRMGCGWSGGSGRWQSRMSGQWERRAGRFRDAAGLGSSGNRAFDDYREATLRRLEEEQREFRDFLERLRLAKDRAEFDEFMKARRDATQDPPGQTPEPRA